MEKQLETIIQISNDPEIDKSNYAKGGSLVCIKSNQNIKTIKIIR